MPARGPRRRAIIAAIPVAAGLAACTSPRKPQPATLLFFTSHQAAVVEAATARIAPGPEDDPAEAGHPGAREADVTGYIDTMLGALDEQNIFAGGPWSNRHTSGPDLMARFTPLDPVAQIAWRKRLARWQAQYTKGISELDKLAGGDFTKKPRHSRTRSWPCHRSATSPACCSSTPSRACTPAPSTDLVNKHAPRTGQYPMPPGRRCAPQQPSHKAPRPSACIPSPSRPSASPCYRTSLTAAASSAAG